MGTARLALIAAMVLAATAGAAALAWKAVAPSGVVARADVEALALARHVAGHVAAAGGPQDPARASAALRELASDLQIDLALQDASGRTVTAVGPELPPLAPDERVAVLAGQVRRVGDPWPPRLAAPVVTSAGQPPSGILVVQLASAPPTSRTLPFALGIVLALVVAGLCVGLARGSGSAVDRLRAALDDLEGLPRGERLDVKGAADLLDVAERINRLIDRAARGTDRDEELLAIVARELRKPIKNARETLGKMASGQPFAHGPTALDEDLESLETVLEDVLTTARLRLDRMVLRKRRTRLGVLVREAAASVASTNPVTFEIDRELAEVDVDGRLMSRAVSEIVVNAAQHSDAGASIAVRAENRGAVVQVQVTDGGGGMTPEDRSSLFDPFHKSTATRRYLPGRTGLGMTLARRVIEAHGGTIAVDSEIGVGTTVSFALPRATGEPPEERPSADRISVNPQRDA